MGRSRRICKASVPGWSLYRSDDGRYFVAHDVWNIEISVSREYVSKLIDKMVPEV